MGEAKRKFKTLKTLTGRNLYRQYDEWDVGDIVVGKIVDFGKDKYDKTCPIIEVLEVMFKDKKENERVMGKRLFLNSCGKLAKKINEGALEEGMIIQLEYLGKNVMEKGKYAGKQAHDVNIELGEMEGDEEAAGESQQDESGL